MEGVCPRVQSQIDGAQIESEADLSSRKPLLVNQTVSRPNPNLLLPIGRAKLRIRANETRLYYEGPCALSCTTTGRLQRYRFRPPSAALPETEELSSVVLAQKGLFSLLPSPALSCLPRAEGKRVVGFPLRRWTRIDT